MIFFGELSIVFQQNQVIFFNPFACGALASAMSSLYVVLVVFFLCACGELFDTLCFMCVARCAWFAAVWGRSEFGLC